MPEASGIAQIDSHAKVQSEGMLVWVLDAGIDAQEISRPGSVTLIDGGVMADQVHVAVPLLNKRGHLLMFHRWARCVRLRHAAGSAGAWRCEKCLLMESNDGKGAMAPATRMD